MCHEKIWLQQEILEYNIHVVLDWICLSADYKRAKIADSKQQGLKP